MGTFSVNYKKFEDGVCRQRPFQSRLQYVNVSVLSIWGSKRLFTRMTKIYYHQQNSVIPQNNKITVVISHFFFTALHY